MIEEYIWSQKYRPQTLEECVLPDRLMEGFKHHVSKGRLPNYLLHGHHGIGKTTVARVLVNEIGGELLFLNGSGRDRGIDTVKTKIEGFATTMSLDNCPRVVLYDEADNLTYDSQLALRSVIESVSNNCSFILTANFPNRIMEPLRESRLTMINFEPIGEERKEVARGILKRLMEICKIEGVEAEPEVLAAVVKAAFPDIRRMINALQKEWSESKDGTISTGAVSRLQHCDIDVLLGLMREKKVIKVYEWIIEQCEDPMGTMMEIYKQSPKVFAKQSLPDAILILHQGQIDMTQSVDRKLCLQDVMTKLMSTCELK